MALVRAACEQLLSAGRAAPWLRGGARLLSRQFSAQAEPVDDEEGVYVVSGHMRALRGWGGHQGPGMAAYGAVSRLAHVHAQPAGCCGVLGLHAANTQQQRARTPRLADSLPHACLCICCCSCRITTHTRQAGVIEMKGIRLRGAPMYLDMQVCVGQRSRTGCLVWRCVCFCVPVVDCLGGGGVGYSPGMGVCVWGGGVGMSSAHQHHHTPMPHATGTSHHPPTHMHVRRPRRRWTLACWTPCCHTWWTRCRVLRVCCVCALCVCVCVCVLRVCSLCVCVCVRALCVVV
jgi:hypothetical protein